MLAIFMNGPLQKHIYTNKSHQSSSRDPPVLSYKFLDEPVNIILSATIDSEIFVKDLYILG